MVAYISKLWSVKSGCSFTWLRTQLHKRTEKQKASERMMMGGWRIKGKKNDKEMNLYVCMWFSWTEGLIQNREIYWGYRIKNIVYSEIRT